MINLADAGSKHIRTDLQKQLFMVVADNLDKKVKD